jgi:uncharacterized protein (TIGR02118 family)
MAAAPKIVVIYPRPRDEAAFEQEYRETHLPMLEEKLKGLSRVVATKVLNSPQGEAKTYRIAELHFGSMEVLQACLQSEGAKAVMEHATGISTGGRPIVLVCEEETFLYW